MYFLALLFTYLFCFVSVPLVVQYDLVRFYVLPSLTIHFRTSQVPTDTLPLTVIALTVVVYVLANFVIDIFQIVARAAEKIGQPPAPAPPPLRRSKRGRPKKALTVEATNDDAETSAAAAAAAAQTQSFRVKLYARFFEIKSRVNFPARLSELNTRVGRAQRQVLNYYPAFVTSASLMWVITHRFDFDAVSLIVLEMLLILSLYVSYCFPYDWIQQTNKIAFQCSLFWSLAYVWQTSYAAQVMMSVIHQFHIIWFETYFYFSSNPYHFYALPCLPFLVLIIRKHRQHT